MKIFLPIITSRQFCDFQLPRAELDRVLTLPTVTKSPAEDTLGYRSHSFLYREAVWCVFTTPCVYVHHTWTHIPRGGLWYLMSEYIIQREEPAMRYSTIISRWCNWQFASWSELFTMMSLSQVLIIRLRLWHPTPCSWQKSLTSLCTVFSTVKLPTGKVPRFATYCIWQEALSINARSASNDRMCNLEYWHHHTLKPNERNAVVHNQSLSISSSVSVLALPP